MGKRKFSLQQVEKLKLEDENVTNTRRKNEGDSYKHNLATEEQGKPKRRRTENGEEGADGDQTS